MLLSKWLHLQRFHVLNHINPRLHHETVIAQHCACIVVVIPVLDFVVRIRLLRFCVPSSTHNHFVATKLLPQTCVSSCSKMPSLSTTVRQYTLTQFLLVDVHESTHPCLCGSTRPELQCSCDVRVLCDVDLLSFPSTCERLHCFRICKLTLHFKLIDLHADKFPAHKISSFGWDRRHSPLNTVNSLTFLVTSNHTEMLCTVLVSISQLSDVMFILVTDVSNRVRRNRYCLHLATSNLLAQLDVPQSTSNYPYRFPHCL